MASYYLYIDESGTKEYAPDASKYGKGISRYFVFGGLLLTLDAASQLSAKIIKLKLEYFGIEEVEIKSNWLRIPKDRQARYLDKYGITDDGLYQFVESYYGVILSSELQFIASVVDKQQVQELYVNRAYYAPAIAYDILLQRAENELRGLHTLSVAIDDMSGATPKGNQYKDNLLRQHERLKKSGSSLKKEFKFPSLCGRLRFVNSASSHLIQVADLASYNVYRQFRDQGHLWEKEASELVTYEHFDRIAPKFRRSPSGRIQGFGVVKFPLRNRVQWGLYDETEK